MEFISFVIPCYGSCRTIENVVREIQLQMSTILEYSYEIILVNDCSPDSVWQSITVLSEDDRIIGIDLTKNFGQAAAVMAGFSIAQGDYIITLDDDGQSPVDAIPALIQKIKTECFDVV
jgi:undecaprenyl-phosphate 4-deoxy-4-formamido-L-arabinose transferase